MQTTGPNNINRVIGLTEKSEIIRMPSKEGRKDDTGKPSIGLIPSDALIEIARVLDFGAKKYDAQNWRKGIQWSRLVDASLRHILSWKEGEDVDPESGLSHLAHAACCLTFLLSFEKRKPELDNRLKHPGSGGNSGNSPELDANGKP